MIKGMKLGLVAIMMSIAPIVGYSEQNSHSAAIVNSYGSDTKPVFQAPVQLQTPILTDMRTGGHANTIGALKLFTMEFSPDNREQCTGRSGKTTIIAVWEDILTKGDEKNVQIHFGLRESSRYIGSITIAAKEGKGSSVDASTIKYDLKHWLEDTFGTITVESDAALAASYYGVSSQGKSVGIAQSTGLSLLTEAISGITGRATTSIQSNISITYLIVNP
jgi:hypothetical protein